MFKVLGYEIVFKHYDDDAGRITECNMIEDEDYEKPVSVGYAWCCPEDQFNRNIGRKLSMSRTIKDLPVETRTAIWEAYFKARNNKW